jgi:hypothetical protein
MNKLIGFMCAVLFGCGDVDTDHIYAGSLEHKLLSDDHFGASSLDYGFCVPGSSDGCSYPPGFGDGSPSYTDDVPWEWKVCIDNTFGTVPLLASQRLRITTSVANVVNNLIGNNAWIHVVNCADGVHNISFTNAITNLGYPNTDIRKWIRPTIVQSSNLSESPSIPGQHRYVQKWAVIIDANGIDSTFAAADRYDVTEHGVGAALGIAVLGAGLHTAGLQTIWTTANVNPIGKELFHSIEFCRVKARYDNNGGANYNILTKQDNNCD